MKTIEVMRLIDRQIEKSTIQVNTITEFGIICHPTYTKKGNFKVWAKRGYAISNGTKYYFGKSLVLDLKNTLKDKIIYTEKTTDSEPKYSPRGYYLGERKATNWTYKIKE